MKCLQHKGLISIVHEESVKVFKKKTTQEQDWQRL